MSGSLRLSAFIPAPPAVVYHAWLNGRQHAAMTGAKATSQARVGGKFTAWNGYIFGEHQELVPDRRIVQSWRTTEFPQDCPDSRLEVDFAPEADGTRLTLVQSELPSGEAERYQEGWQQFYFAPIRSYFERLGLKSPAVGEPITVAARAEQAAAVRAEKPAAKRTASPASRGRRKKTTGKSRKQPAKKPAARPKRPAKKPAARPKRPAKPAARRTKPVAPKTKRKPSKGRPTARRKRTGR